MRYVTASWSKFSLNLSTEEVCFALTYEIFVVDYRNPNPYRVQLICKFLVFFPQCFGVESRNDGENLKAIAIYFPFIILGAHVL